MESSGRRRILKLAVLVTTLFAPTLPIAGCSPSLELRPSSRVEEASPAFHGAIDTAREFAQRFTQGYFAGLSSVPASFREDFLLVPGRPVAVRVLLSSAMGAYLYLEPGVADELIADCTPYPAQAALFLQLARDKPCIPSDPEVLARYKRMKAMFENGEQKSVGTMTIEIPTPRLYVGRLPLMLTSLRILVRTTSNPIESSVDRIGFVTDAMDFALALESAYQWGVRQAQMEIVDLYLKSEFFREALAHPYLRERATAIEQKWSRSRADPSFEYPLWQLRKEMHELEQEARSRGVSAEYVAGLLNGLHTVDGFLLYYFANPVQFMWQWTIANFVLLIMTTLVSLAFRRRSVPLALRTRRILQGSTWALPIAVNGWIFIGSRPPAVTFQYWLIPGALFLASLVLPMLISVNSGASEESTRAVSPPSS